MTRSSLLSAFLVLLWLASPVAFASDGPSDVNGEYPAVGAYYEYFVLLPSDGPPEVILIGSGSEVQLCVAAYEQLKAEGVRPRVVNMPSWELFERQPKEYRDAVLPPQVRARVAVEAGTSLGWREYVGLDGSIIARRDFGASAPIKDLPKQFGFTPERVVAEARSVLGRT